MMLELIDKYKFGIVAVFASYLFIFMYTKVVTYDHVFLVKSELERYQVIEQEQEIELTPENVQVPADFSFSDARNLSQNMHDNRPKSMTDYSQNRTPQQISQDIKSLEAQMKAEAGGSAERARLEKMIQDRKVEQANAKQNAGANNSPDAASPNQYAGTTMVSFDLNGRKAYLDNDWYVRNPGYTCNNANGVVVVNVKTNSNGDVISAVVNQSASSGTNPCMIENALKYAKMSRFEFNTNSGMQSGYIKYTFITKR